MTVFSQKAASACRRLGRNGSTRNPCALRFFGFVIFKQLHFSLAQFIGHRNQVKPGLSRLNKNLFPLFLDMVIDVFTQHRHPGVIQIIVGTLL